MNMSGENRFQLCAGLNLEIIEYNFKRNQPYLSRGSNSLNSASGSTIIKTHRFDNRYCIVYYNVDTCKH